MARKRMIDPNIWQSEDFGKLSLLAKIVFIGLFSNADDEGRGRANPVYLKSTLFPYEESMRSADIEKTLSEISSNMSVVFYSYDGSDYYSLYNWDNWQKIDKPTESKLPAFDENNTEIRRLFVEGSSKTSRSLSPNKNRIEKNMNKKKKEFVPPTLEEIKKYIDEKQLKVKAEDFYNYFTEGKWIDSKGNQVKNWKQKLLTWNGYAIPKKEEKKKVEQRQYSESDFNQLYANSMEEGG